MSTLLLALVPAALLAGWVYRRWPYSLPSNGLRLLRMLWVWLALLFLFNPQFPFSSVEKERPLVLVMEDRSGSTRGVHWPVVELPWADTLRISFGTGQSTSIDSALTKASQRLAGKSPAGILWLTDGVLTHGMDWRVPTERYPGTHQAIVPNDTVLDSGWKLVSIECPTRVQKEESVTCDLLWQHTGNSVSSTSVSVQWGNQVLTQLTLPAQRGPSWQNTPLVWKPEETGNKPLFVKGQNVQSLVSVLDEKRLLIVFSSRLTADISFWVDNIVGSRRVESRFRKGSEPEKSDFDAAIWLVQGEQAVWGEERFQGAVVRLPSSPQAQGPVGVLSMESSWGSWDFPTVHRLQSVRLKRLPKEESVLWNDGFPVIVWQPHPARMRVGLVGFQETALRVDSGLARLPGSLIDRLWSARADGSWGIYPPSPSIPFTKQSWRGEWNGWDPSSSTNGPTIHISSRGNFSFPLIASSRGIYGLGAAVKPGLYSYQADGEWNGEKRRMTGIWRVLEGNPEAQKPTSFFSLRRAGISVVPLHASAKALAQWKQEAWAPEQWHEQKKSRSWRDFWWALVLAGLLLGAEAFARKHWTGEP